MYTIACVLHATVCALKGWCVFSINLSLGVCLDEFQLYLHVPHTMRHLLHQRCVQIAAQYPRLCLNKAEHLNVNDVAVKIWQG